MKGFVPGKGMHTAMNVGQWSRKHCLSLCGVLASACAGLPKPLPAHHGLLSGQPEGGRPGRDITHGPHRAGTLCVGSQGPWRPAALAETTVTSHWHGCHGHQPPQAQTGHPCWFHLRGGSFWDVKRETHGWLPVASVSALPDWHLPIGFLSSMMAGFNPTYLSSHHFPYVTHGTCYRIFRSWFFFFIW